MCQCGWLLLLSCFSRVRLCDPIDDSPPGSPRPWDSPGKNTGVGCHFLLQCMTVKRESEVAQLCLTVSDPMDCRPPGSFTHGIFQARVLEWGAVAFSAVWVEALNKTEFMHSKGQAARFQQCCRKRLSTGISRVRHLGSLIIYRGME